MRKGKGAKNTAVEEMTELEKLTQVFIYFIKILVFITRPHILLCTSQSKFLPACLHVLPLTLDRCYKEMSIAWGTAAVPLDGEHWKGCVERQRRAIRPSLKKLLEICWPSCWSLFLECSQIPLRNAGNLLLKLYLSESRTRCNHTF